jgi:hypothetical protein
MKYGTEGSVETDLDCDAYRAVSGWAIAALLLGLASASAVAGPVLLVVPLAAIAVALVAMRRIGTSEGGLIGRNVALLGLLLAVLFAVAGTTRTLTRQIWLQQRGQRFAEGFVQLLQQNKPHAAHQLTVEPGLRKPMGENLEMAYINDPETMQDYQTFVERPQIKTLLDLGQRAKVEPVTARLVGSEGARDYVEVRFLAATGGQERLTTIKFVAMRMAARTSDGEQWQIVSIGNE